MALSDFSHVIKAYMALLSLPLPPLLDLTTGATGHVKIRTVEHKFSPDAAPSGTDPKNNPVFGSKYRSKKNEKVLANPYGLPLFKFKKGVEVPLVFTNRTGFSWDMHWHGLNTTADIDGATEVVSFGAATKIGEIFNLTIPPITNNSALLWVHAHPMFYSSRLIYGGVIGAVLIEDDESVRITEKFIYGDNHIVLIYQDADLHSDGSLDSSSVYADGLRSCFGLINGVSCVNWYARESVPFVNKLQQVSGSNLIKIDVLNGTSSFRILYLGVIDKHKKVQPFYLIQSDTGFRAPEQLKIVALAPANRISILIDLDQFEDNEAELFFYDFDLTEVFDIELVDDILTAKVPFGPDQTPNPTPIPGSSDLTYPVVPEIPQITEPVPLGNRVLPKKFGARGFLRLSQEKCRRSLSLERTLRKIHKLVFGSACGIHSSPIDYLSLLNPKYFYNLPDVKSAALRRFILFPDDSENAGPRGATEFIDGANRVVVDLWNSDELDLEYALIQYQESPNNWKPKLLPGVLFKIFQDDPRYINYAMSANDKLTVQLYTKTIEYGDESPPFASVDIIYPPTDKPLNINQWIDLVNSTFAQTIIRGVPLSDLLQLDWTFYPYQVAALSDQITILKSVLMKLTNNSLFYIRLKGSWALLQFFGKPIAADMAMAPTGSSYPDNFNMNIQMIYPQWATSDPDNPIFTFDNTVELIVKPQSTYMGPVDGFENDNLMNFSVKKDSTEKWIYYNRDTQDSHPLHFHLTSGFVDPLDPQNKVLTRENSSSLLPRTYSMDTYSIGSQTQLSFYLKFLNYISAQSALEPPLKYLGYMYHCHYLTHHDMSMMGQYFVYEKREDFF